MKKILSVLLVISIITPFYISGCSKSMIYSTSDIISFSEQIKAFTEKYDSYDEDLKEDEHKINPELNRLIIEATDSLSSDNAVDTLYSVGYQIFQYDSKEKMEADKKYFSDNGYKVFNDRVLKIQSSSFDDATESELWSYKHLNINYSKSKCSDISREVIVGVMDTGVEYEHPLLCDRVIENDVNFSTSGNDNSSADDNGHGTAVSGVIAHSTPDNVKIKPYKILSANGTCTELNVIAACEYILSQNNKPDILNMSFGGYNFYDLSIERDMCDKLVDAGVTVVISSGNEAIDVQYVTPADSKKSIVVGAYGSNMNSCDFSNYGEGVDIAAPGERIFTSYLNGKYYSLDGTSFSAPFVAAGCAYIKMLHPNYTVDELKQELFNSCIYMGSDEEDYFGSGMLSLVNIVADHNDSAVADILYDADSCSKTVLIDNIPESARVMYTTDLTIPTLDNGIVYNSLIKLTNDTHINYALFDENDNYIGNIGACNIEIEYKANDDDFEISDEGVITAYLGNRNNVIVPDMINGIVPVEVGIDAFSESEVTKVVLPESVTVISYGFRYCNTLKFVRAIGAKRLYNAFAECGNLRSVNMPNVIRTSGAFKWCYKLRSIDFEESLQLFGNAEDFAGTAITHLNFPNAVHALGSRDVFKYSNLISISIPCVTNIVGGEFDDCKFLQKLYAPQATSLGSRCFEYDSMLNEFDASNISYLSENALQSCYIDVFYAPLVTTLTANNKYVELSKIRVLKLPGLTGTLGSKCLDYSYIECIYLDNITSMSSAFSHSDNLKVLSMPKCTNYIDSAMSTNIPHGPVQAPLQVLWIPSCTSLTFNCVNLRLLFAPSLTSLDIKNVRFASLVLGNSLEKISMTIADDAKHRIIAPENSYAIQYAKEEGIPYTENESAIDVLGNDSSSVLFNVDNNILKLDFFAICDEMDFGYIYDFNESMTDNAVTVRIDNSYTENGKRIPISYSVLTGASHNSTISIRAYLDVGGVVFYSPVINNNINFSDNLCITNHKHLQFEEVNNSKFIYTCGDCNTVISKNPDELMIIWNSSVINKPVDEDSPIEYKYLNVVSDNWLNAKDFARILHVANGFE